MTSFLLKANSSKGGHEHDQPREISARTLGLSLIIFLVVLPLISKDLLSLDAVSMADIRVIALGLGAPQKTPILAKWMPVLDVSCESTSREESDPMFCFDSMFKECISFYSDAKLFLKLQF